MTSHDGSRLSFARSIAACTALALALSLTGGVPAARAATTPPSTPVGATEVAPVAVAGTVATAKPRGPDPEIAAARRGSPKVDWPAAGAVDVTVRDDGSPAEARPHPVRVTRAAGAPGARVTPVAAPSEVRVEVLDRPTTERVDVPGVLLRLHRADGVVAGGPVAVEVDYSGFRHAYGGDWASRLTLTRLPGCLLSTPEVPACRRATAVPSRNDAGAGRVRAEVTVAPDPALAQGPQASASASASASGSGSDSVYALVAAPSGNAGSFQPTSLSPSATWEVGLQSGDFTWSYPMGAPEMPGLTPEIDLSYSSGSVDGRVASTNNQPSWAGEGFSLDNGFIERSYRGCADDGQASTIGDLCWVSDNAVVELPGMAGELVRDDATGVWRAQQDTGWRVELLTGAANGDNNGEHWRLTSPDGTQYFFGRNRLPGWAAGDPETNSAWNVPVFGNQAGEPCHAGTFAASWCQQAYRWNLDYVVDRNGDAMVFAYEKETNFYGRDGTPGSGTTYVRGGHPTRVEYGLRAGALFDTPAPGRVVFTPADRCTPGTACVRSRPENWPDVPWDQHCATSTCDNLAPSFWGSKRLAKVTTQVYRGGGYQDVDSWALTHSFPVPTDGTSPALWLDSLVHTGHVGGTATLPPVTFDGVTMENRVDAPDAYYAMYKRRIQDIYNETGGRVSVRYQEAECARATVPAPDNNDKRCYPVLWGAGTAPTIDWFHKYLVEQVTESDLVGGNPDEVVSYEYVMGGAGWRHDDTELVTTSRRSWGQWRGHQVVRVRAGPIAGARTLTEHVFLRGMDGDINRTGDPDTVTVEGLADKPSWSGLARLVTVFNGDGGEWLSKTITEPVDIRRTATRNRAGAPALEAYLVGEKSERTVTPLADGSTETVEVVNSYDPTYGTVTQVDDLGDLSTPDDDACIRHTYARNPAEWIVDTESRVESVSVRCSATPSYPDDLLADERVFYDGADTWGAAPTAGNVTLVQEAHSWSGGPVYVDAGRQVLDVHGRAVEQSDSLGNKSSVAYTPAVGGPLTGATATNALGHSATVTTEPLRSSVIKEVDVNGRTTEMTYDPLGRLTRGWAPGRSRATQSPTTEFSYQVRADAPSSTTTRSLLGSGSGYLTSHSLLDGFLRTRQTQSPSPAGGRLLTDTYHDAHGRVDRTNGMYWNNQGSPGTTLIKVADSAVPAQTRYVYDGVGRELAEITLSLGQEKWRTTSSYGGNWTAEDPPDGETATMSVVNADGDLVELRQYHGGAPTGTYDSTRYTYSKAGGLSTVTDPAGNVWRYFYDLQGRKIRSEDPDSGTSTTSHDSENRVTSTTDGRGRTVAFDYDALGRMTGKFDGSPTGTKLAGWEFDTLPGGKGMLTAATTYLAGQQYRDEVLEYDAAGRATRSLLTVAGSELGQDVPFQYEIRQSYNLAGQVTTTQLPAVGDLPAETIQHGYDPSLGLPTTMRTAATRYVDGATYTELGEPKSYTLGATGRQVVRDFGYEPGTRRLGIAQTKTKTTTATTTVSDIGYTYDPTGNLTRIADQVSGDRQCFRADYLRRLTEAWTPATDDCAAAPNVNALGGPAAYWHSYAYDKTGNRTSEVQHGAAGDTSRTYTYPAAGEARPHALGSVRTTGPAGTRTETYDYDAAGNTIRRPASGAEQALVWDVEGQLTSVSEGGDTTSFGYDSDGERLVRRDPAGTTIYLGMDELHRSSGGGVTVTRQYHFGGGTVAVRTGGGLSWLVPDHHGTGQLAIDATSLSVARRYLLPFGAPRGAIPTGWPGEKGFVGGDIDSAIGLTHLGAREYDPLIGRFISVDPIIDVEDPQQMHGYAYGNNNPTTYTDADGLRACEDEKCTKFVKPKPKAKPKAKTKPKPSMRTTAPKSCGGTIRACDERDLQRAKKKKADATKRALKRCGGTVRACDERDLQRAKAKKADAAKKAALSKCGGTVRACDERDLQRAKKKKADAVKKAAEKAAASKVTKSPMDVLAQVTDSDGWKIVKTVAGFCALWNPACAGVAVAMTGVGLATAIHKGDPVDMAMEATSLGMGGIAAAAKSVSGIVRSTKSGLAVKRFATTGSGGRSAQTKLRNGLQSANRRNVFDDIGAVAGGIGIRFEMVGWGKDMNDVHGGW